MASALARRPLLFASLLPSLTDVAYLMPVAFLFGKLEGARTLLGDGDTGWHIRAGEWMLANARVPRHDLFSFTKPDDPWFAWEWLAELLFAWLHQHGMAAVVLATLFLICLTSALLYRLARRTCGNVLVAIALTLLAMAGSSLHWLARPHVFTLLFVVIWCGLLERARLGETRALVWLPLGTVVWTNLHGGFIAGLLLVACYGMGELVAGFVDADRGARRAAFARSRRFGLTLAACLAASLANPYFFGLHRHLYHYLVEDGFQYRHINEFLSLSFHHPAAVYFELMLAVGMAAAFWNVYRRRFAWVLPMLLWAHLALFSARNIPIFLLVAVPPVAAAIDEWLLAIRQADVAPWLRRGMLGMAQVSREIGVTDRIHRLYLPSLAASAVLVVLFYAPSPPHKFRAEFDPQSWPVAAAATLRAPDRVFTQDEWGDYLIYRLYPRTKVFVDGRSDFYGAPFSERYLDVLNVRHDWEQHLRQYGIDTVLLPTSAPLAGALKQSWRWRAAYDDGVAIVFRAEQDTAAWGSGIGRDREITKTATQQLKPRT